MNSTVQPDDALTSMYERENALIEKISRTRQVITPRATAWSAISWTATRTGSISIRWTASISASFRNEDKLLSGGMAIVRAGTDGVVGIGEPLYRLVNPNRWYAFIVMPRLQNTLVKGGVCDISFEGYEEKLLTAHVYNVIEQAATPW